MLEILASMPIILVCIYIRRSALKPDFYPILSLGIYFIVCATTLFIRYTLTLDWIFVVLLMIFILSLSYMTYLLLTTYTTTTLSTTLVSLTFSLYFTYFWSISSISLYGVVTLGFLTVGAAISSRLDGA